MVKLAEILNTSTLVISVLLSCCVCGVMICFTMLSGSQIIYSRVVGL
jgi:hypothetical protein